VRSAIAVSSPGTSDTHKENDKLHACAIHSSFSLRSYKYHERGRERERREREREEGEREREEGEREREAQQLHTSSPFKFLAFAILGMPQPQRGEKGRSEGRKKHVIC
jgi:hypothetical protein